MKMAFVLVAVKINFAMKTKNCRNFGESIKL